MSGLWINGHLIDKADARVSPFDHGFLYGDGVWEHLRAFDGKLFRPQAHLDLLYQAADALGIAVPLSRDELHAAIDATLKANDRTDGYVRVIVTRGPGTIGPDPRKLDPQVIIIAEEYQPFPAELYGHGLHAVAYPQRIDVSDPVRQVRSLGQPHLALAKQYALRNGCLEAVLTNVSGAAVGTTEGVLFAWQSGSVYRLAGQKPDATGEAVAWVAQQDFFVLEHALRPSELLTADEVFLAGTACGVIGIVRLDGQNIGTGTEGPVTKQIRERYHALVRGGG